MNKKITQIKVLVLAIITLCASAAVGKAQTTQFTYQGRLNDTTVASPTNGTYEMQFKLFTTAQTGTGTQIDAQLIPNVSVVNGIFTVQLDAENSFNSGADLYIEISVRPAGSQAAATTLSPRQQVTSAPYSIRSLNAGNALVANNSLNLGGLAANTYIQTGDSRLSDSRDPLAGSQNYIQNSTIQQPLSNFSISGGGNLGGTLSANLVNSVTNYRIGGSIVLATPNATSVVVGPLSNYSLTAGNNAFFGYKAGAAVDNTGQGNVFFGSEAGTTNSNGAGNSFVGRDAGFTNSSGSANSFFGNSAGKQNTTASFNSFFGTGSGNSNTTGERNSFFGFQSGQSSKIVDDNTFFGYQSGKATTSGQNTFFGSQSGDTNTIGSENTFVGFNSGGSSGSKNIILGSGSGAGGNQNTIIGYQSGANGNFNTSVGTSNTVSGNQNTIIGYQASSQFSANHSTAIGAGAVADSDNTVVLGTSLDLVRAPGNLTVSGNTSTSKLTALSVVVTGGSLKLTVLASPTNTGNQPLCLNGNNL
ncbi:MAG: hypothetical protein M3T96_02370, partial [Acidobacteriota bacterium]|nr:hypothetical protein [Acidobacteriota bacterium]